MDFKPKVTTFKQRVLVSTILYFIWGFYNVINMYVTSNFQIKILPEYWNVFWYMLQAGSLGCRLGWSLVLGYVSGAPLGSTLWNQEGQNGMGQRNTSQITLVHIGCSWRGCWFKPAHWQHFQQLDTESLKGGQDRTSPCSPHSMITAAEVGDEDVLWGKLLMTDM